MAELSPAAQAVDTELARCIQLQGEIIRARPLAAAALKAVADQVVPYEKAPDLMRSPDLERLAQRQHTRTQLLTIAAELRGTTTTETP